MSGNRTISHVTFNITSGNRFVYSEISKACDLIYSSDAYGLVRVGGRGCSVGTGYYVRGLAVSVCVGVAWRFSVSERLE